MKNSTDQELLGAIKGNDHAAFEVLFNRYWEYLYSIIYRRLKDRDQAQDIVQDIFIYIWNSRASLSVRTGMEPYLFTAAKNQLYSLYRREKLKLTREAELQYQTPVSAQTDELVLFKEVDRLVTDELERMPDNVRKCFTLSREEGKSIREIALELMLSEKTVKNNISDALKRLRVHLGSYSAETLSILLISEIIAHQI
ncbi:RNA polymerase sigma-70 factor (family 1) [Pedobacter africanus]|uniref:RNA polymerase sigma-70 factor (ECF subfamily) n=1 Tax=Pedobacter africanus TaxID=151894 RepID=A0ACC6L1P0_9SPHI|nr:RNA polymerase sigma-70 factor [Pedobacter africanus]MDR6785560.1 RNA polymerase sigma-70 factor (ECF subfamily) [Pedobacter africanus]